MNTMRRFHLMPPASEFERKRMALEVGLGREEPGQEKNFHCAPTAL